MCTTNKLCDSVFKAWAKSPNETDALALYEIAEVAARANGDTGIGTVLYLHAEVEANRRLQGRPLMRATAHACA